MRKNKGTIYPYLNKLGDDLRRKVDAALQDDGVVAHSTGVGSLFETHFAPRAPTSANHVADTDKAVQYTFGFALMTKGDVFVLPGHLGAISTVHDERDIDHFADLASTIGKELNV